MERVKLEYTTVLQSMSRRKNCLDNAVLESFFHSLKVEEVYTKSFKTREEAKNALFEYTEIFYNRMRKHSTLGMLSPKDFEEKQKETIFENLA